MSLPGFSQFEFNDQNITHDVYVKSSPNKPNQPGVLIIHELPGIIPETLTFAERLHADGYRVYLPHLFGPLNRKLGRTFSNLGRLCISREFTLLAARKKSPITDWLRSLARHISEETGASIAAIGMCFGGGFVLGLMMDDTIAAPVVSQPSHCGGVFGDAQRASIGASPAEIQASVERSQRDNIPLMGFRFSEDKLCTQARFDALSDLFGENFRRFEIDSSLFNRHWIPPWAHSVFTWHYVDKPNHPTRKAYELLLDFLQERLAS